MAHLWIFPDQIDGSDNKNDPKSDQTIHYDVEGDYFSGFGIKEVDRHFVTRIFIVSNR